MMDKLYLGCISGTSVDGLDIALLRMTDRPSIEAGTTVPLPTDLRDNLLRLANPSAGELDLMGYCDAELGEFIGSSLLSFLDQQGIPPTQIRAIGSHGQTIRHRPTGEFPFTLQIGDPNKIAEVTGITTVADLRRRDMAANGQGAPLVPPFHQALFESLGEDIGVVNIGGISNISVLSSGTGYDTGPGNCLMDDWCQRNKQLAYDAGGNWAATGTVDADLLTQLLSDAYFQMPPPKSTGREYFNRAWVDAQLQNHSDLAAADVQATLSELTASCIATAAQTAALNTLVICGGGRLNTHLMGRLQLQLERARISPSEDFGEDGDAIEAAAFAWLAHQNLEGLAGNLPGVTGASGTRVLGGVYPGRA